MSDLLAEAESKPKAQELPVFELPDDDPHLTANLKTAADMGHKTFRHKGKEYQNPFYQEPQSEFIAPVAQPVLEPAPVPFTSPEKNSKAAIAGKAPYIDLAKARDQLFAEQGIDRSQVKVDKAVMDATRRDRRKQW